MGVGAGGAGMGRQGPKRRGSGAHEAGEVEDDLPDGPREHPAATSAELVDQVPEDDAEQREGRCERRKRR